MTDDSAVPQWRYYRFGMIVTGKGEAVFLPSFMRSLTDSGNCNFVVIGRANQLSPIVAPKKKLKMAGTDKKIPDRDVESIGLPARQFLQKYPDSFVFLIDDLEHHRKEQYQEVFERYRDILDAILPTELRHRASIQFFANMVEAYYFAHIDAVNVALELELPEFEGDVEQIRHPKGKIKQEYPHFDEIEDGRNIVSLLDLDRVLSDPETCASLRVLFDWCWQAKKGGPTERFRLHDGIRCPVTIHQVELLTRGEKNLRITDP